MRKVWIGFLAMGLIVSATPAASAQDAMAIIDKAIKAHGGADKLAKMAALRLKTKGTIELLGNSAAFTQESAIQMPDKIKDTMQLDFMGQNIGVVTVFDGKKGWINANGMTMDMNDDIMEAMKEAVYMMSMQGFTGLKDKKYELSLLGDAKVNDRPAVGVKISSKGHKDVNVYFDKESGLMAKMEHRTKDLMSGQEVAEERIVTDYHEVDGIKTGKKVLVNRDGKKFLEAEVLDIKFPDKIDDGEFTKP
jgi:hypothetical protein